MKVEQDSSFRCRACNSADYTMILDLGVVPLANAFVRGDEDEPADAQREPLALVMCNSCRLLQIRDEVPRAHLFSDYLWRTSTSAGAINILKVDKAQSGTPPTGKLFDIQDIRKRFFNL